MNVRISKLIRSYSTTGILLGILFFAFSLSPSLLPRNYLLQGILSGLAVTIGYGIGVAITNLLDYLGIRNFHRYLARSLAVLLAAGSIVIALYFNSESTLWQNSIRGLMGMEPVADAYVLRVIAICVAVFSLILYLSRSCVILANVVIAYLRHIFPARISFVLGWILLLSVVASMFEGVFARTALRVADNIFLELDELVDEDIAQPTLSDVSGSRHSLVSWDSIGRRGKEFLAEGPSKDDIGNLTGRQSKQPIRVYVGLRSAEKLDDRVELAVSEMKRSGAFSRTALLVAVPTGTGWLDPDAVDTFEYLHNGDTAITSVQYSYLPSWMSILVDPELSIRTSLQLFSGIYEHWKNLPADSRPELYLHGLSLGALGSEAAADLFKLFDDPINGAVWSGPPFPSSNWKNLTRMRSPESPAWRPVFREGTMVRFMGQYNSSQETDYAPWGRMRFIYLQYASDPMTFFDPSIFFKQPEWLQGDRGPDVSPYLKWYPVVTFIQLALDLPMSINVPDGFGHNYAAEDYINAWLSVSEPDHWSPDQLATLKSHFRKQHVWPSH